MPDELGFETLLALWARLGGGAPLPVAPFVAELWRNVAGQLSFLRFAIWAVRLLLSTSAAGRCAWMFAPV